MRREQGQALVMVLVVMIILQAVAWALLYRVNVEQRLAGDAARSLTALYLAEAGLQKALDALEEGEPPADWVLPHQEALGHGTFTIEALDRAPGGLIAIVVRGEVAGAYRRVKALVRSGPQALIFALSAQSVLSLDGQARTYVLSTRIGESRRRRVGDLAAWSEVRFEKANVTLNTFEGVRLPLREGDVADWVLSRTGNASDSSDLVDLVLGDKGRLFSGVAHRYVTFEELRRDIPRLGVRQLNVRNPPPWPSIDEKGYRALAESNTANAEINAAVAAWGVAAGLETKAHSQYTRGEFEAIRAYLMDHPEAILRGPIYVEGPLHLLGNERLTILDGALGVSGDILLKSGARLEVQHGPNARVLPGIMTWNAGSIKIERGASAIVSGLVLADEEIVVSAGTLDVIGAIAAKSFYNRSGTVVVRYDSVVLATAGLRKTGKGVSEVMGWQESP